MNETRWFFDEVLSDISAFLREKAHEIKEMVEEGGQIKRRYVCYFYITPVRLFYSLYEIIEGHPEVSCQNIEKGIYDSFPDMEKSVEKRFNFQGKFGKIIYKQIPGLTFDEFTQKVGEKINKKFANRIGCVEAHS